MMNKFGQCFEEMKIGQELKKAIYGKNTDLGEDDIRTSKEEGAIFARNMLEDLSKYVNFPSEEQRTPDHL